MTIEELADAEAAAKRGAALIALKAREAVSLRGVFTLAVSGGKTPWVMLRELANEEMPWKQTQLYFGDERHVRPDHPDSNYRMAHESMLKTAPLPAENVFPIATDDADQPNRRQVRRGDREERA